MTAYSRQDRFPMTLRKSIAAAALLGASLGTFACPALADQNLVVSDNGTVHCDASLKDLTRITLAGDQFASISKVQAANTADDFEVVNEPLRGDIYISVGQGFSRGAISFFATTRKGYVYKFLCTVAGVDARQVFVANADMAAPRAISEELPADLSPQEEAARLIAALYAQRSVAGYDIDWRPLAPVSTGTMIVQRIGRYLGPHLVATLLKLTNTGASAIALHEDDVGPPDAVAISLTSSTLAAKGSTTAFVVTTRKNDGSAQ